MEIKRVKLKNFRGFKDAEFIIPDNSVLIGANNSGKTTILDAIALTLGRSKLVGKIDDYDFFGGFFDVEDPMSKRFFIKIVIVGFEDDDPSKNENWIHMDRSPIYWWNKEEQELKNENEIKGDAQKKDEFKLATEIGCCGYYDEDKCDYEIIRYFVNENQDPVIDEYQKVTKKLLRNLGVFFLPSNRTWEKMLTFNSSSFIKLLNEEDALPSNFISSFRNSLVEIEPSPEEIGEVENGDKTSFGKFVKEVERELKKFGFIPFDENVEIHYRPTRLDVESLLSSLYPHLKLKEGERIPLSEQGSGFIALQNLMIILQFAKNRRDKEENVIFLLEEPELHLFPELQKRITQMARGISDQTIITTHSPHVAASFPSNEVLYIQNENGIGESEKLSGEQIAEERKNIVERYFHEDRMRFCSAIMGGTVLVPEGKSDANWLEHIKNLALHYDATNKQIDSSFSPSEFTIVRTKDGRIKDTLDELHRFNCQFLAIVDGDSPGDDKKQEIRNDYSCPIFQWGTGHAIEDIVAWVLEAGSFQVKEVFDQNPDDELNFGEKIRSCIRNIKKETIKHEQIIYSLSDNQSIQKRAFELFSDISKISNNTDFTNTKLRWEREEDTNTFILEID